MRDADRRVDVTVGGQPFTSYIYPTSLMKPVLYPLRTAAGTVVTRGYPLEPRQGERVDHPHHAGLWFEYGNVSGIDFWNNSTAIKKADAPKMGTILHRAVKNSTSGAGEGTLDVVNEWVNWQGRVIMKEDTKFIFRAHEGFRSVDRITTLTAVDSTVTFTDDKEGLIGMRVARSLEQPSNTPEKFVDAT
ncbi:MAG TPA: PmoA family protein, partial [Gemmatimonadaceae bacterium]